MFLCVCLCVLSARVVSGMITTWFLSLSMSWVCSINNRETSPRPQHTSKMPSKLTYTPNYSILYTFTCVYTFIHVSIFLFTFLQSIHIHTFISIFIYISISLCTCTPFFIYCILIYHYKPLDIPSVYNMHNTQKFNILCTVYTFLLMYVLIHFITSLLFLFI